VINMEEEGPLTDLQTIERGMGELKPGRWKLC
jgi:hypothetical protein